ncbi:MAG: multicopper oxidase domain-containing protein [Deltaproteobacteria bacterium]|nr:multicopper oxidase domain-containing protein [Deltaproteobacteria bacterium]
MSCRRAHLGLIFASILGCGAEPDAVDTLDPAAPFPPTGQTKTFDLHVKDVDWEVGLGAMYRAWTYEGTVPGPTLEATAGDRILINLINETTHPASIHTHVVEFPQAQDGASSTSIAMPGQTIQVEWNARYAGTFPYHDHAAEGEGVLRGLFGALVVHAPGEAAANEHVVVLGDLEPKNFRQLPGVADPVTGEISQVGTYRGAHQYLHVINGKAYEEAIPVFRGKVGERSRWRIVSIGKDVHTWHIHGHRWADTDGQLTDNIQLSPGMYRTFEFMEEAPGSWLVHCHFPEHMEGGMMARYEVSP